MRSCGGKVVFYGAPLSVCHLDRFGESPDLARLSPPCAPTIFAPVVRRRSRSTLAQRGARQQQGVLRLASSHREPVLPRHRRRLSRPRTGLTPRRRRAALSSGTCVARCALGRAGRVAGCRVAGWLPKVDALPPGQHCLVVRGRRLAALRSEFPGDGVSSVTKEAHPSYGSRARGICMPSAIVSARLKASLGRRHQPDGGSRDTSFGGDALKR